MKKFVFIFLLWALVFVAVFGSLRDGGDMPNLGLSEFDLDIRSYMDGFRFDLSFRLAHTRQMYHHEGTAPSPTQCFDAAMAYMTQIIREAV